MNKKDHITWKNPHWLYLYTDRLFAVSLRNLDLLSEKHGSGGSGRGRASRQLRKTLSDDLQRRQRIDVGFHLWKRQRSCLGAGRLCGTGDHRAGNWLCLEDYLRIGIASQVDGIILEADGSEEERNLIQEALEDNIPVVTVLTDDSSSDRISFVGLNSYQLGNAYTEQILGLLKENQTTQVMLLSNSQSKTQETNLIY